MPTQGQPNFEQKWKKLKSNKRTIRSHIEKMDPYQPILPLDVLSKQLGMRPEEIVKLDANENPYGTIPEVLEELGKLPYPNIYPDPESRKLRKAISALFKIPQENILAGAGADDLIDLLIRLILNPGDSLINCPPTFGMYNFDAEIGNFNVINVPRNNDFSLDLKAIKNAVHQYAPKLLFLANPNNPDGSLLPDELIDEILDLPLLLVLDEAYIEFAQNGKSRAKNVLQHNNLIVLRTFSKWAGLAGLRIGYGILPDQLFSHAMKIKQPYNVSSAASVAAITALKNIPQLEKISEKILAEKERLFKRLANFAWLKPLPSETNFILCWVVDRNAGEVKEKLAQRGVLVRHFEKPGLRNYLRISVGKPEHSEKLIQSLEALETL
jgi:histidinol-phosphate aminotransferase